MPWTEKQVRYLLSKKSPLTLKEQEKVKRELHRDPSLIKDRKSPSKKR